MAMDSIYYETDVDASLIIYDKGSGYDAAFVDSECTQSYTTQDLLEAYTSGAVIYLGNDEFALPVYFKFDTSTRYGYIGYLKYNNAGTNVIVKHLHAFAAPLPIPDQKLPQVTSQDNGKRLAVDDGEWAVADPELPNTSTTDNGKILKVVSGKWSKASEKTELPSVSSSDDGKVLGVVDGEWAVMSLPS